MTFVFVYVYDIHVSEGLLTKFVSVYTFHIGFPFLLIQKVNSVKQCIEIG